MRSAIGLVCLGLAGCIAAPVEAPNVKVYQTEATRINPPRDKVDLLFMIDNSGSMEAKQAALRARVPRLMEQIRALESDPTRRASYHIGVVTSDFGLGKGTDACATSQRPPGMLFAGTNCLPANTHFIEYDQRNGTTNLGATSVEDAFACLTNVGVAGCGIEQQLETVYQALTNPPAENAGFLRDDAILAVIFLTDEDDCSAVDVANLVATKSSFQCASRGYVCNEGAPSSDKSETLTGCGPQSNPDEIPSQLIDLGRYINLFQRIKLDPSNVILIGIDGPVDADRSVKVLQVKNPAAYPYEPCGAGDSGCQAVVDHSCATPSGLFADPAIRLHTVINAHSQHHISSICDDDYAPAIDILVERIETQLHGACLQSPIEDPTSPDCQAYDLTYADDGHISQSKLIQRCVDDSTALPCWQLVEDAYCPAHTNPKTGAIEHYSIEIRRDPAVPELPRTQTRIDCATIAQ